MLRSRASYHRRCFVRDKNSRRKRTQYGPLHCVAGFRTSAHKLTNVYSSAWWRILENAHARAVISYYYNGNEPIVTLSLRIRFRRPRKRKSIERIIVKNPATLSVRKVITQYVASASPRKRSTRRDRNSGRIFPVRKRAGGMFAVPTVS